MSDRFTVTAELEKVYEITYRQYSDMDEHTKPEERRSFATEKDARKFADLHNVYVTSFALVQKLEW